MGEAVGVPHKPPQTEAERLRLGEAEVEVAEEHREEQLEGPRILASEEGEEAVVQMEHHC